MKVYLFRARWGSKDAMFILAESDEEAFKAFKSEWLGYYHDLSEFLAKCTIFDAKPGLAIDLI